jgi:hypothetical protein
MVLIVGDMYHTLKKILKGIIREVVLGNCDIYHVMSPHLLL